MANQSLAPYNGGAPALAPVAHERAFEPGSLQEAIQLAQVLHAGRMLPKHLSTPEAVVTAIVMGRELGLSAMQAVRGIHVIEGKPTLSADMMGAVVQRSPVCEYFRLVETTDEKAVYETKRRGHAEPIRMSFTAREAEAAGLLGKDNWRKFRAAMLRARCSSALARAVYPDLLMGVYDPDELDSAPAAPPVRINAPDAIDSTASPTAEGQPELTPEELEQAEWDKANKRLRAVAGDAAKRYGIAGKSIAAGITHLLGGKSAKDVSADGLNEWADAIKGDPSILANAVTAVNDAARKEQDGALLSPFAVEPDPMQAAIDASKAEQAGAQ